MTKARREMTIRTGLDRPSAAVPDDFGHSWMLVGKPVRRIEWIDLLLGVSALTSRYVLKRLILVATRPSVIRHGESPTQIFENCLPCRFGSPLGKIDGCNHQDKHQVLHWLEPPQNLAFSLMLPQRRKDSHTLGSVKCSANAGEIRFMLCPEAGCPERMTPHR
jgi:hypothetical protein